MTNQCKNTQYVDICKGEFALLHNKLDKIDVSLRGNGKPGITTRIDRLEQDRVGRSRLVWLLIGIVGTFAATAAAMVISG